MAGFDAGTIVPSTRDLLQAISTRRTGLAMVALVEAEKADVEAARLDGLDVAALAFAEVGPAMTLAARSTRSLPSLSLSLVDSPDACLAARFHGADGACFDGVLPLEKIAELSKAIRATRMLPLAVARSAADVARVVDAGAKAIVVRAASVADAIAAAAGVSRSIALVAHLDDVDEAGLRALSSHVDAAIVPLSVHGGTEFAALIDELA